MSNRSSDTPVESKGSTSGEAWFVDYELPPHFVAQHALEPRDHARLMVLSRLGGVRDHAQVRDLPRWLKPGDLLVFNDTRVLPARLVGRREQTGGAFEMLFVRPGPNGCWEVMAKTGGKPGPGTKFFAQAPDPHQGTLELTLEGRTERKRWLVRPSIQGDFASVLERFGRLPLPPYIRDGQEEAGDRERYQTVYAATPGSVAAPTAGLHFTRELLRRLAENGVDSARVTLHVGPGTFQTIQGDPAQHQVEPEWGAVSAEAVEALKRCRAGKGRVIAVGTTTTRVLESAARIWLGEPQAWTGEADLTIRPGHEFRVIDGLMTNFHLPKSSLLLLVGALTGCETLKKAYNEAIERGYRFYSYGDAMLILPGTDRPTLSPASFPTV